MTRLAQESRRLAAGRGRLVGQVAVALALLMPAMALGVEARARVEASRVLDEPFYDVDSEGRLLRIDYQAGTAKVLATLDPESPSPMLVDAWVLENPGFVTQPRAEVPGYALLLYQEAYGIGPSGARIHLLSLADGSLRETSLVLYVAGRGIAPIVRPLAADWAYVEYTHWPSGEQRRFIFDLARNAVLGTSEESLGRLDVLTLSADRSRLYHVARFSGTVRQLEPATGRLVGSTDLCAALTGDRLEYCTVQEVDPSGRAVVWERSDDMSEARIHLMRVDGTTIASSEPVPFFVGSFRIREREGETIVVCAEEERMQRTTGRVLTFQVAEGRISSPRVTEEADRRPLGYASLIEISSWFYGRLPTRTFPPEMLDDVREWGVEFRELARKRTEEALSNGEARPLQIEGEPR